MKLFSKSLTATDCLKRLSIPEKVRAFLPDFQGGHAVELQVICETRQWSIGCTIRNEGYKKPVLSRGWRKFVVGNRLSVGDELTLHREEDETGSLHYRVEVRRATGPFKTRRRNKLVGKKRMRVVNCKDQASDHQFGISVVGIASATEEIKNNEKPAKKIKLFGSILRVDALVVGAGENVESKTYDNSLEQFGLTVGGAEPISSSNDKVNLRVRADHYNAKVET